MTVLFGQEHVDRYRATDGEEGHIWLEDSTILLLTTTGRKTGNESTTPLIYQLDGGNPVLVASKGGAPEHPGWYVNLLAQPSVAIQVWERVIPVTARTGTAADKARVWPMMAKQWPGYDDYQAKAGRDIPVVLLHPR